MDLNQFGDHIESFRSVEAFWKTPVDCYFKVEGQLNASFKSIVNEGLQAALMKGCSINVHSSAWHWFSRILSGNIEDVPPK